MAWVARTIVTLRFFGEDLDPDRVTALLGAPPTDSRRKGESKYPKLSRTGAWLRSVECVEPGDLDGPVVVLFSGLAADLAVWRDLSARYDGSLSIGLFMGEENEGTELRAASVSLVAARGLRMLFDIYGPLDERRARRESV
jgi:hypothetical protein